MLILWVSLYLKFEWFVLKILSVEEEEEAYLDRQYVLYSLISVTRYWN